VPKKINKTEKALMRCEFCGKPFVLVGERKFGKKTRRVYRPNCEHYPKDALISIE